MPEILKSEHRYSMALFTVNSIVCLKYKAVKGVLEKIAIKEVMLRSGLKTGGQIIPVYKDTLNSLYNEEELCTHEEALDLIAEYRTNLIEPEEVEEEDEEIVDPSLYPVNSVVYLRYKAIKGILEKIAIKDTMLQFGLKTGGQIIPVYKDTLNFLYNEEELCTYQEALDLVAEYNSNLIEP